MTKTHVAFLMSTERLGELGKMFFWTFTFAEKLDITETRDRWNHFLTLMKRRWPKLCGLRVFELHKSHGLHVHLVTNSYLDVDEVREMAIKAGWGRIHAKHIPASRAAYLGKYLSKERPPCFKRWRLWAAFGKEWTWTKVGDLAKNSAFSRTYHHLKEQRGWKGNRGFIERMQTVADAVENLIRRWKHRKWPGVETEIDAAVSSGGAVLIY